MLFIFVIVLKFNIINPPENYSLNAFIIENNLTNPVTIIQNDQKGHIEWHTPNLGGDYFGTIIATNLDNPNEVVLENVYLYKIAVFD